MLLSLHCCGRNKNVRWTLMLISLRRDNSISQAPQLMIFFSSLYQSLMDTKWFSNHFCSAPTQYFWETYSHIFKNPLYKVWQNLTPFFFCFTFYWSVRNIPKSTHIIIILLAVFSQAEYSHVTSSQKRNKTSSTFQKPLL